MVIETIPSIYVGVSELNSMYDEIVSEFKDRFSDNEKVKGLIFPMLYPIKKKFIYAIEYELRSYSDTVEISNRIFSLLNKINELREPNTEELLDMVLEYDTLDKIVDQTRGII